LPNQPSQQQPPQVQRAQFQPIKQQQQIQMPEHNNAQGFAQDSHNFSQQHDPKSAQSSINSISNTKKA